MCTYTDYQHKFLAYLAWDNYIQFYFTNIHKLEMIPSYTVSIFCYFNSVDKFNVYRNLSTVVDINFECESQINQKCACEIGKFLTVDKKKETQIIWFYSRIILNHIGTALQGGWAKLDVFKRKTSCLEPLGLLGWSLLGVSRCNWKRETELYFFPWALLSWRRI